MRREQLLGGQPARDAQRWRQPHKTFPGKDRGHIRRRLRVLLRICGPVELAASIITPLRGVAVDRRAHVAR